MFLHYFKRSNNIIFIEKSLSYFLSQTWIPSYIILFSRNFLFFKISFFQVTRKYSYVYVIFDMNFEVNIFFTLKTIRITWSDFCSHFWLCKSCCYVSSPATYDKKWKQIKLFCSVSFVLEFTCQIFTLLFSFYTFLRQNFIGFYLCYFLVPIFINLSWN